MSAVLELFCCYAREDQEMLANLKKHLMPLQRQGQIIMWSDTDLQAGMEWEKELHRHLESADIILLLISPDFMNSDYCYSTEMKRAIERHELGSACVIPILLRSTLWRNAPFAKLQMIPTNAKPIRSWSDIDDAFHSVTEQVNWVVSERQIQRMLVEADRYAHTERYQEALVCYEHILHLAPANEPARFGKARTLASLSKGDVSMETFPPAILNGSVGKKTLGTPLNANCASRETQQKEQTMQSQPSILNRGNISINAPVTGNVVDIGHGGTLSVNYRSQNTPFLLDRAALKVNLQELFEALGDASLPVQVRMEVQTAIGRATQQAEAPILSVEAMAQHLQYVGLSLRHASVTVEKGSRLATAIIKLAYLFGPVVGGTRVVTGWFGINLP